MAPRDRSYYSSVVFDDVVGPSRLTRDRAAKFDEPARMRETRSGVLVPEDCVEDTNAELRARLDSLRRSMQQLETRVAAKRLREEREQDARLDEAMAEITRLREMLDKTERRARRSTKAPAPAERPKVERKIKI